MKVKRVILIGVYHFNNPGFDEGKVKERNILTRENQEGLENSCLSQEKLEDVLLCLNSDEQYKLNKGLYISFLNRVNDSTEFFGSDLVASWYKRNLIMYANIQNAVVASEKNIVIIAGAGHAAMMEEFIKNDKRFNLVKFAQALSGL